MSCRIVLARLALSLVAALSLACATRPPLTCPGRGGPVWSELTSPHLVLRTDVDPGEARRLVTELEGLYEALAHVMPRPRRAPAVELEVVVLDRRDDYTALRWPERGSGGFFTRKLDADFEPQPIMVFYDDPLVGRETVFLHELAHRFLRERFASLPIWLDEGLAQLYSTIRVESDHIVVGEPRSAAYVDFAELPSTALAPSVSELLAAGEREFHAPARRARFYAAAWRLTHLLASRYAPRFSSFLDDLERGASGREAFAGAFGDDMASIEAAHVEYLTRARLPTHGVAYRPPPEAPREHRVMRDAGVHLLWARLRPRGADAEAAALQDLDEALAREPGSAEARYLRASLYLRQGREDDAVQELDAALAARPEDPRYLYARLVARAARGAPGDEARPTLLERLSLVAKSATQLGLLADEYGVGCDRVNEGLLFAERALRADPMCWWCEKTRSRILFRGRRYTEAVAAADRALALLPDREPATGLRSERAFLARLRDAERSQPPGVR